MLKTGDALKGLIGGGMLILLTACGLSEGEASTELSEALVSTQEYLPEASVSTQEYLPEAPVSTQEYLPEASASTQLYLADMDISPLYAAFLQGEIQVANPYVEGGELSFFDERDYTPEQVFVGAKKSFSLVDVNGDGEPELIFRMEDSPSELMYILGVLGDELICYDVFETHTTHLGFTIYDNGIVCWGQNYDGSEDVYYCYDSDGKPRELIHFVGTGEDLASGLDYEYYYLDGEETARFSLESAEEYERLIAPYEGGEPEWFGCDAFADIPHTKSLP